MTIVYGSCVEPGGMKLVDDSYPVECPECSKEAVGRSWEAAEGGSLNSYYSISCRHCGFYDTDWSEP